MRRKKDSFNNYGFSFRLVVFVIAAIGLGFIAGFLSRGIFGASKALCFNNGSYEKGVSDSKARLEKSGLLGKVETKWVFGVVISIKGSEITFSSVLPNPLLSDDLKTRVAVINDKTEVIVKKLKTSEELKKDIADNSPVLEELNKQISVLKDNQLSSCSQPNQDTANCQENLKKFNELQTKMAEIQNVKMSPFIIENKKLSELSGKLTVNVFSDENISEQAKFQVNKVEIIEAAQ